ncbi:CDGSH iron-sulfur domain-containing protein [Fodinibius sp.]|uniref:CDGSH iron-sulfur domain-containing protein n=1 Tax=Fodinibius sp. TaxID=1872440 RepID=UPI00356B59EB
MKLDIYSYQADDITVEYDQERCIHAAECVKNLPSVFDPDKRPWIQPEHASPGQIKKVVHSCPTGALKYRDTEPLEEPETRNAIIISPDGPVFLRGDIEVHNAEGKIILKDTRLALCRCGESRNKPLCDNSHRDIGFEAPASFDKNKLRPSDTPGEEDQSKLVVKLMKNGPALIEGTYRVYSMAAQPVAGTRNIALCRCGSSSGKPFCDGTHKEVGFEG